MSISELKKEKNVSGQTRLILKRTFGELDILEVYTDYVAHIIKEKQFTEKEEKK